MASPKANLFLCQPCQTMFAGDATLYEGFQNGIHFNHHRDFESLMKAVKERCRMCVELWRGMKDAQPSRILSQGIEICFLFMRTPVPGLSFQVYETYEDKSGRHVYTTYLSLLPCLDARDHWISAQFVQQEAGSINYDHVQHQKSIDSAKKRKVISTTGDTESTTNSLATKSTVKNWLQNCIQNHVKCKPSRGKEEKTPSRILDVGESDNHQVYLRFLDPLQNFREQYATLSHRWGSAEHPKLTKSTEEQLVQIGIQCKDLPKTFREAVEVTRYLGLRYLWIDSLCIYQDSPEDWRSESAKMGGIYEGCTLNIAATVAEDSDDGLFYHRDPLLAQPLHINIQWPLDPDAEGPLTGQPTSCDFDVTLRDAWSESIDSATLNTRAWVAQERTLSPRILHFGRHQVYWECKTAQASEAFPRGLSIPRYHLVDGRITSTLENLPDTPNSPSTLMGRHKDIQKAYQAWTQLIKDYSACEITEDHDMLIAFSGIAKAFEKHLNDTYLAGILMKNLHYDLLWHVNILSDAQPARLSSPSSWRAPSWSWASIKGDVAWNPTLFIPGERRHHILTRLLQHHITSVGSDPTGQVSDAWIKLEAHVIPLNWSHKSEPVDSAQGLMYNSWPRLGTELKSRHMYITFDDYKTAKRLERQSPRQYSLAVMPVLAVTETDQYDDYLCTISGLVLSDQGGSADRTKGRGRVGYFECTVVLEAETHEEAHDLLTSNFQAHSALGEILLR